MTNDKTEKPTINITSNYQSGGITAHTVNINPTYQRALGDIVRQKLLENIPKDKLAVVWFTSGNEESFRYASEIHQFMKEAGYNVFGNGPTLQIFLEPLYGLRVSVGGNADISVGIMSDAEKQAARNSSL